MEDFEGKKEIINLFNKILGSKVSIKDNISKTEETLFTYFVNKLDESHNNEEELFELSGLEVSKYTNPLWDMIENLLRLYYGEEWQRMISWYVLDRLNPDGAVIPIEDENGKQYKFENPSELWSYLNHRHKK